MSCDAEVRGGEKMETLTLILALVSLALGIITAISRR